MKLGRLEKSRPSGGLENRGAAFHSVVGQRGETLALLGDTIGLDLECEAGASKGSNAKYKDLAYV